MNPSLFDFTVHKHSAAPLYLQIYQFVRGKILSGVLLPGERLPATRMLAAHYGVARQTVKEAYSLLLAEGFLSAVSGSGTFVHLDLPMVPVSKGVSFAGGLPLSKWSQHLNRFALSGLESAEERPLIDFGFGRAYPHIFPYDIWRRMLGRYLSTDDMMLSRYGSVAGFLPLRQAIATYVQHDRGVRCQPDQVVIVNGAQQAFDLLARLFIEPGDGIFMESPGYPDAYALFQAHGADIRPFPVDAHGMPVEQLPPDANPKLLFITPANQFPRGGALPAKRRLKLLAWVNERDSFIIEDDYDGALRYEGRPLTALQGLDRHGRVIYLGTFSKVLFPALRLAYVILPEQLVDPFLRAKRLLDRGAPTLTQAAVSDFMAEGHFMRHLRRLRQHYGGLRRKLVTAVDAHLGASVQFSPEPAGLHLMLYLQADKNEQAVVSQLRKEGVHITPGAPFHFERPFSPSLLLGFSKLSPSEVEQGLLLLKSKLLP